MRKITVFTSYSHRDEEMRQSLERHLSSLVREDIIELWADRAVDAGGKWAESIDSRLEHSDVVLLLISDNFLSSDYCYDVEMKRAIERHDNGDAVVVPVILKPSDWQTSPFARFQALPRHAKPITTWRNRNDAFADVAKEIRRLANTMRGAEQSESTEYQDNAAAPSSSYSNDPPNSVITDTASTDIELVIDTDFASFDEKKKQRLLAAIGKLLEVGEGIKVISKRQGSVRLTLRLSPEQAERLLWAAKAGELSDVAVVDAEITRENIYELAGDELDIVPGISDAYLDRLLQKGTVNGDIHTINDCLSFLLWDSTHLCHFSNLPPAIVDELLRTGRIGFSSYRHVYKAIQHALSTRGVSPPRSHYIGVPRTRPKGV
jgi:hypothetical protein